MLQLRNTPIALDASFLRLNSRERTEAEIERIVCSVKFELLQDESAVRLLGPNMTYHLVDPYLPEYLRERRMSLDDIFSYKSSTERIDICFEDSWSGGFIAERLQKRSCDESLTIIHLDDHSDMMATLLSVSGNGLVDPTNGVPFDPRGPDSWISAIHSGAVNIGNYLTPLYYSGSNIHIRHLNNVSEQSELSWIVRDSRRYDLIPQVRFATIAKTESATPGVVGTYLAAPRADPAFLKTASDWVIVHIDLDYFINDFNGASRGIDYRPDPALRSTAAVKLNNFFDGLAAANIDVDRWIIATSPGFCSAYHWAWLLSAIEQRIYA